MLVFGIPALLATIDLVFFLIKGKRFLGPVFGGILDVAVIVFLPILYAVFLDGTTNSCCGETAAFSPDHKLTIYTIICLCIVSYFYLNIRTIISSPVAEVVANVFLLVGIGLNITIALHDSDIWFAGNLPIIILFLMQLGRSHKKFLEYAKDASFDTDKAPNRWALRVLSMPILTKLPVLTLLCLPFMVILIGILLMFGQRPDSIVRAFTDTYKHGFSQLDYLCDNVYCDEHFLCTVAARGHKELVKPVRAGERMGNKIICNRQLLVANAFEELLEDKLPRSHRYIRRNYNKLGRFIHRYYGVFTHRWVADMIYLLMKPLEWCFLLVLYISDRNPENRIARQYMQPAHRQQIKDKGLR